MLRCMGEGVRQNEQRTSACVSGGPKLLRWALSVALAGVLVGGGVCAAGAQTYGSGGDFWSGMMQMIGLEKSPDDPGINYTERSPLVVPPSRDLTPPGVEGAVPPAGWPTGPAKRPKKSGAKPPLVPNTAVQTPNPQIVKKPWYDPRGWFDKEEYANFTGEPVRKYLTDPPAGYRIPSPEEPYGIGPDKKGVKPQASPSNLTQVPGTSSSGNPPPSGN
jgi:hypothetical protein